MRCRRFSLLRRVGGVLVRVLVVFLTVSLCSYVTVAHSLLRVAYETMADYADFVKNVGRFWDVSGAFVLDAFWHSFLVVSPALAIAFAVGVPLGLFVGVRPHSRLSPLLRLLGSLGTMTPSFFLALFILVFFVRYVYPATGIRFVLLTSLTTDIDPRRVLPISLTLAARPLAHVLSITSAKTYDVVESLYIRTAHSKGIAKPLVLVRHVWPNVVVDVLNAIPLTFLFALSSLPIVDVVFGWPGVGLRLLFGSGVIDLPLTKVSRAAVVSFLLSGVGAAYILVLWGVELLQRLLCPLFRGSVQR